MPYVNRALAPARLGFGREHNRLAQILLLAPKENPETRLEPIILRLPHAH